MSEEEELPLITMIGIGVGIFAAIGPALWLAGFIGRPMELTLACVIALVGGAIGGALFSFGRAPTWIGTLAGPIMAIGALMLTYLWARNRESLWALEVLITVILGGLPGAGLYALLLRSSERDG